MQLNFPGNWKINIPEYCDQFRILGQNKTNAIKSAVIKPFE